jgi:predicted nucleotidyltransferase
MDKATVVERVREYAQALVRQNVPLTKVILFGSHAVGSAREDSDIDVAVVVSRIEGDWLGFCTKLFRLTRDIDLRIEPIALEEAADRSGFLAHILNTGEVVYSRAA